MASIPAIKSSAPEVRSAWRVLTGSVSGLVGLMVLGLVVGACVLTVPWTFGDVPNAAGELGVASVRYDQQVRTARHLPPFWAPVPKGEGSLAPGEDSAQRRLEATARVLALERIASERARAGKATSVELLEAEGVKPSPEQIAQAQPRYWFGTDLLGRSMLVRCLAGGGLSLGIGIAAALISVVVGTLYGSIAGYFGGRLDAVMMRVVDVLYGLPYVLLVVLLAVAMDALVENWQVSVSERASAARQAMVQRELAKMPESERANEELQRRLATNALVEYGSGEIAGWKKQAISVATLLVAIGGVSWLTMARVVRGQVLSLKSQPFMEAARAMGVGLGGQFWRHLLPNLVGPIVVYATLTVPQAILQESFLSFLGIGVKPPLPSWGNLAADGLSELNPYKSHWWMLAFPCVLLGVTLLALNFVGEGVREALDPKRNRR